jgi:hypothetical protein
VFVEGEEREGVGGDEGVSGEESTFVCFAN